MVIITAMELNWLVHHSDSYAATLVPSMIEMGIDVWQGCMETNNHSGTDQEIRWKDQFHGWY